MIAGKPCNRVSVNPCHTQQISNDSGKKLDWRLCTAGSDRLNRTLHKTEVCHLTYKCFAKVNLN